MKTLLPWIAVLAFSMSLQLNLRAAEPAAASAPEPTVSLRVALSSIVALMEQSLQDMERQLKVLALTEAVQSADWDTMRSLLVVAEKGGTPRIIWYAQPDGAYFAVAKGRMDQSLADRPYFPAALRGETVMGALVISRATGKKSMIVAVPVMREGKVSGVLGTSIFVEDMSAYLTQTLQLPKNVSFYALAADGSTSIHNDPGLQFIDARAQGSPSLTTAVEKMLTTESGEVTYEFRGATKRVLYMASPLLGWRFAVGVILE